MIREGGTEAVAAHRARPVAPTGRTRGPRAAWRPDDGPVDLPGHEAAPRSRAGHVLAAFALYQALGLVVWWHLLAGGIGVTLPAGSADVGQEVWFLAWLPHALGSGTNPFFSHALFAPAGVNLLSNTSIDLVGLLFSPVTVLAGPAAALDVASIIAPALSALAAFALCRRYVRWQPAAFVGGLCYGFGPFLATDLRYAHLDLTWLALPPLIFIALDELFVTQRRRPAAVGAALGALVVLQFFVSTEMLAITVLTGALGLVLAAARRPWSVGHRLRRALPGLAVAAALSVAALAYPLWAVVAGPRHEEGAVWPSVGRVAASLAAAVQPRAETAGAAFVSGGNGSYLGVGLIVVLAAGAIAFWRSVPLRLALALVVGCFVASLGYELHVGRSALHVALPAAVLGHLPLLNSLVPARFAAMVDLFSGVALAVVVDRVRRDWPAPPARRGRGAHRMARRRPGTATATVAAMAVGLVAVVPLLFVPPWPYPTATVVPSPALGALAVAPRATVAVYPDSPASVSDEMVWQAEHGFPFDLADGYAIVPGPDGRSVQSPRIDALWLVFAAASVGRLHLPLTPTTKASLRVAVGADRVDEVVILPGAAGSLQVRRAMVSALGAPTRITDGASIWSVGRR